MASPGHARPPESLAERFWSLARAADGQDAGADEHDPVAVVRHVVRILDSLDTNAKGAPLTERTVSFLTLLHQQEAAGDLSYASPEQARGDRIDERSLVFSVGVLIFERLTGRHPFGSTDGPRRVARMQRGELGSGVQYFPQVPSALRAVLMRSMGPFPEERYASMAELRAELDRFVGGVPLSQPVRRMAVPGEIPHQLDISEEAETSPRLAVARRPAVRAAREPSPAQHVWIDRLVSAAIGAVVASVVVLATRPQPATMPIPAVPAAQAPASRRPAASPLLAASATAPPQPASAAAAAAEPVVVAIPPPEAAPPIFEPEHAGERAATALHACFESRVATFGIGILFPKGSTRVRRVYLAKDEPLSPVERRCVVARLVGLDVGVAPATLTVVELRLRLQKDGSHSVRASLAPP
jgi:serine/threonine-protein kinase